LLAAVEIVRRQSEPVYLGKNRVKRYETGFSCLRMFGVGMLAVSWYVGLKAAIRYEITHSPTYEGEKDKP
jgi:hypothetical protein